jgi:hypothetical protein
MWNEHISSFLISLEFVKSIKDSGLYILRKDITFLILVLYINDSFFFNNDLELTSKVQVALSNKYEMTDLEDLYFGFNLQDIKDRESKMLSLSQSKYM